MGFTYLPLGSSMMNAGVSHEHLADVAPEAEESLAHLGRLDPGSTEAVEDVVDAFKALWAVVESIPSISSVEATISAADTGAFSGTGSWRKTRFMRHSVLRALKGGTTKS
jgi:hypothetical protein